MPGGNYSGLLITLSTTRESAARTVGIPPRDLPPDAPSYDQLQVENAELQAVVGSEATQFAELRARLADLVERLGRNPRNSSMLPSAEGFSKPPAPSRTERRAAARKQGKQPRAPGSTGPRWPIPTRRSTVHHARACRAAPTWTMPRWSTPNAVGCSNSPRSAWSSPSTSPSAGGAGVTAPPRPSGPRDEVAHPP